MNISVLGSGGWGTAISLLLLENGHEVSLWSYLEEESAHLRTHLENPLLPGIALSPQINYTSDIRCVSGADAVVLATPSFALRQTAREILPHLEESCFIISLSKGIEEGSSLRLSEVIAEETKHRFPITVLVGPSHAEEVAKGVPTGLVAACEDRAVAEAVQDMFLSDRLRVYSSTDIIGVELGAALKNVMALCVGCCTGMGYGDNTKAMLMTRGLSETARLGVALGGKYDSFTGLAGMGDLIVTCTSLNSRNNRAGILVGQGVPVEKAIASIGAVVEGYYAIDAARALAQKAGVEMPITEAAYQVFYEGANPEHMVSNLMRRRKRHETEDNWR